MPYKDPVVRKQKKEEYYQKNKEKTDKYRQEYRIINAKKISEKTIKWQKENPELYASKQREWRRKNKERRLNHMIKSFYGITVEDYKNMLIEQEYKCKICGTHQDDLKKQLHIDHCHTNKNVRGLLCQSCNSGLGFFKDNIDFMNKAIKYLNNDTRS
jgi:hypothetical protein